MSRSEVEASVGIVLDRPEKELVRVLHVDDDENLLRVAKECLQAEGLFEVETAWSVEEALRRLEKEEFDVVVSDYQMPGKDGLTFLKELRDGNNHIPFVMFTDRGREEVAIKALNYGADQYLNKSEDSETSFRELARSISKAVEGKKAEEELQKSEEKFRVINSSAKDAMILMDCEGKVSYWNPAAERIFGYTKEEAVGREMSAFLMPESFHKVYEEGFRIFRETGNGVLVGRTLEFTMIRKDGTNIPVELSVSTFKLRDRWNALGIARDITERKKAEESLRKSQKKFEGLFMGNPEAAVHIGSDFRILEINPRFEGLFGYTLNEIKGKLLLDLIVPEERLIEGERLDKEATKGYVYHDSIRKRKDGSSVPVSISAAPIVDDGRIVGYIAMYRDISELKNIEKKLETVNEKLQVVGRLTRHDVRNKLSVITGNLYLNKKKLTDFPDITKSYDDMESACKQIVRIFDFAKDYEMLGAEELTYVDLEKMVNDAISLFSDLDGTKVVSECHGFAVLADSLLRQLFYNFIDNSLKHGKKTTEIRIHCEKTEKEELRLYYEDNGVGISSSEKPKLFKEGYSTKGSPGYGLYLIGKIVEAYGWTIGETGEPGKGAQFTLSIPKTSADGKPNYRQN